MRRFVEVSLEWLRIKRRGHDDDAKRRCVGACEASSLRLAHQRQELVDLDAALMDLGRDVRNAIGGGESARLAGWGRANGTIDRVPRQARPQRIRRDPAIP